MKRANRKFTESSARRAGANSGGRPTTILDAPALDCYQFHAAIAELQHRMDAMLKRHKLTIPPNDAGAVLDGFGAIKSALINLAEDCAFDDAYLGNEVSR